MKERNFRFRKSFAEVIRVIDDKQAGKFIKAVCEYVFDGTVTVVSELGGNLIVQVKDSRIALDRTMANRVMI